MPHVHTSKAANNNESTKVQTLDANFSVLGLWLDLVSVCKSMDGSMLGVCEANVSLLEGSVEKKLSEMFLHQHHRMLQ